MCTSKREGVRATFPCSFAASIVQHRIVSHRTVYLVVVPVPNVAHPHNELRIILRIVGECAVCDCWDGAQ